MGTLFESLVVGDVRIYAQPTDARVYHYRDSNDVEVDIVVEAPDGTWAGFEVKLGSGQVDSAIESLNRFQNAVDTSMMACLGVIVGTGYAYRRDDGVCIIPIGHLGP